MFFTKNWDYGRVERRNALRVGAVKEMKRFRRWIRVAVAELVIDGSAGETIKHDPAQELRIHLLHLFGLLSNIMGK